MKKITALLILLTGILAWIPNASWANDQVVNVYSSRIEKLIKPAFDAFTKKTGIRVEYLTAKEAELIERLKAEGKFTKADVLITVDAGNLWLAKKADLLQAISSDTLNSKIPASLRDPDGHWYGLTVRARTIVYSKERVQPDELSTYEQLGDPKWKDRLCLRTSKKVYNKSLVGTMIKTLGAEKAKTVVEGWMKNNPKIEAKDSGVLKAIAAGKCDVGIVNTYYLGRELKKDPHFPVGLFWANQMDRGTHVNISGAGVTKHAKHLNNAVRLLEFLASAEAQNLFADDNMEYPVNPDASPNPMLIKWWGKHFKQDSVNIAAAGEYQMAAVQLMERAGYR